MPKELKGAVRVNALTLGGSGSKSLPGMEDHGKRRDKVSQERQVSRKRPLVYGTLDLRAAYDRHVAGARMNAGATRPVLHMIVQFPDMSGPDAPAPFRAAGSVRARQKLMLDQAVAWANETHGGNAVFAGRVDRDEKGQWTADLFLSPKYEKITKTGKSTGVWVSTTKHGKELAQKHQDYIRSRHSKATGDLTGPRHVGIALNADFREYFERVNGVPLTFIPKDHFEPDRVEPEAFAAQQEQAKAKAAKRDRMRSESMAEFAEEMSNESLRGAAEADARRQDIERAAREAESRQAAAEKAAEDAEARQAAAEDAARAVQTQAEAKVQAAAAASRIVASDIEAVSKVCAAVAAGDLPEVPELRVPNATAAMRRVVDTARKAKEDALTFAAARGQVERDREELDAVRAVLDTQARNLDRDHASLRVQQASFDRERGRFLKMWDALRGLIPPLRRLLGDAEVAADHRAAAVRLRAELVTVYPEARAVAVQAGGKGFAALWAAGRSAAEEPPEESARRDDDGLGL